MRKKCAFSVVLTLGALLVLELALAAAGVDPVLYREDPYVGFSSYIPLFEEQTGRGGRTRMVTARNKLELFNEQRFPKEKRPGTYRIFCMGGSTTYGHPYDDAVSFCGWLREFLEEADDSRRWEVINAGGISYASYRVAKLMEELARYEPDLFIIYSGQNEFLERRTYGSVAETPPAVRAVQSLLMRTRTYSAVREVVRPSPEPKPHSGDGLLPGEVRAILDNTIGPEAYHRDDALRAQVLEHYRFNLGRMADIARSAGADVIYVTPASKLRDCAPFKSEHRAGLGREDQEQFVQFMSRGRQAAEAGEWDEALDAFDRAVALDDRYAEAHYRRGRALWHLERYAEAKAAFMRARDEDVCPLRALTPMRDIVADVAAERDAPLVDFVAMMARDAEHGVPGDAQFLDHVHPTVDGYRKLALALLDRLIEQGVVRPNASWGQQAIEHVTARVEARLDRRARAAALRNLSKTLGWAGKKEEADKLALQAVELSREDSEALHQAGNAYYERGDLDQALAHYRRSLELAPNSWQAYYGVALVLGDQGDAAGAMDHYAQAIRLNPDFADAHYNLARLYERRNDLEQAAAHYREAIRAEPGHFYSRNNLGIILARQGDLETARLQFEAALKTHPDFADAHVNLASVFAARGDRTEALRHLREALRLQPDHPLAARHLESLQGDLDR